MMGCQTFFEYMPSDGFLADKSYDSAQFCPICFGCFGQHSSSSGLDARQWPTPQWKPHCTSFHSHRRRCKAATRTVRQGPSLLFRWGRLDSYRSMLHIAGVCSFSNIMPYFSHSEEWPSKWDQEQYLPPCERCHTHALQGCKSGQPYRSLPQKAFF